MFPPQIKKLCHAPIWHTRLVYIWIGRTVSIDWPKLASLLQRKCIRHYRKQLTGQNESVTRLIALQAYKKHTSAVNMDNISVVCPPLGISFNQGHHQALHIHHQELLVYAVLSDIQDLWKLLVDFCKCIFYTYLDHNICTKNVVGIFWSPSWIFGGHFEFIIFWTLFSINQLLLSKLLCLTSLYLMYFILLHHTKYQLFKIASIGVSQIMKKSKWPTK